jgi:hypothetical protein
MALTADDIRKASDEAAKYTQELSDLSTSNGVKIQDLKGNDAATLLKASGAGLATGAAVGAAVGAAFPPLLPFTAAAGAIIGAIASFLAAFHFGPTEAQKKLAEEIDKLSYTISKIVLTVPPPWRARLLTIILDGLRSSPGPITFCLGGGQTGMEGAGCVLTSITGLRAAASGIDQQVKDLLTEAQATTKQAERRALGWRIALGGGLALALGYGIYSWEKRR